METSRALAAAFAEAGSAIEAAQRTPPDYVEQQVGSDPLGALTGAPPDTLLYTVQIRPRNVNGAVQIVQGTRFSKGVVLTAPDVGFTIFIGSSGVNIDNGVALTPGVPYEVTLKGYQELYAVTDSPVFVPLGVQIAPLLIGDVERP